MSDLARLEIEYGFRAVTIGPFQAEKLFVRIGNPHGDLIANGISFDPNLPGLVIVNVREQLVPTIPSIPIIFDPDRYIDNVNGYPLIIELVLQTTGGDVKRERRNTSVRVTSGGGGNS